MKKYQKLLMAVASGLLLWAAWPVRGVAPLIFIALVPVLFLEERISKGEKGNVFWLSFVAFLVWNVLTTWWVWNATPAAILAWILNSLFMSTVFWAFHFTKMKLHNSFWGNFLLIPYWMAFEFLHYYWAAKWPWLNLGNVFSTCTTWVQWYSVTGVAGGTLWILLVNILINNGISSSVKSTRRWSIGAAIALMVLTVIGSKIAYHGYEEKGVDTEVIVIQQNCDPWNEQFNEEFYDATVLRNISLADSLISPNTRFIVSSESAIQEGIKLIIDSLNTLDQDSTINSVRALRYLQGYIKGDSLYPILSSIYIEHLYKYISNLDNEYNIEQGFLDTLTTFTQAELFDHYYLSRYCTNPNSDTISEIISQTTKKYSKSLDQINQEKEKLLLRIRNDSLRFVKIGNNLGKIVPKPQTAFVIGGTTYERNADPNDFPARKDKNGYYYVHNSALLIDSTGFQYRNKSKLTPAVEAIPEWMGFLKNFSITMGIARGTLKTDPYPHNMSFGEHQVGVAICYESAFGGYVSEFARKGADLLFVSTNDGWWGDTPGYKQHFEFSKLRAIENRRCVARSANTGRSGFFNQKGDVLQSTEYWKEDVIKATLKANTEKTFYTKHGDYLYRIAMWMTYGLLLVTLVLTIIGRFGHKKQHRPKHE